MTPEEFMSAVGERLASRDFRGMFALIGRERAVTKQLSNEQSRKLGAWMSTALGMTDEDLLAYAKQEALKDTSVSP